MSLHAECLAQATEMQDSELVPAEMLQQQLCCCRSANMPSCTSWQNLSACIQHCSRVVALTVLHEFCSVSRCMNGACKYVCCLASCVARDGQYGLIPHNAQNLTTSAYSITSLPSYIATHGWCLADTSGCHAQFWPVTAC